MRERLDLMHEVAKTKWNARRPIRDPQREAALVSDMVERGRSHGLDPDFTRAFFVAQIDAAVAIQEADFRQWQGEGHPPFADTSELAVLRQQIDTLNADLLVALSKAHGALRAANGQEYLRLRSAEWFAGLPPPVRDTALRPLHEPELGR